jgi:FdhD protein
VKGTGPPALVPVDTVRWSAADGGATLAYPSVEEVVTEEPLEIRLAHAGQVETVSVTMRTPSDDAALAVGFLFTEGILTDPALVAGIDLPGPTGDHVVTVRTRVPLTVDPAHRRSFFVQSSCGVCGRSLVKGLFAEIGGPVASDLSVGADVLAGLPSRLRAAQRLFDRTGGLHAAGLFERDGSLLEVAEDIGRHNAVDKVVGRRFLAGRLPDRRAILQVSGRVSYEIVQKAAAAGIPVVAAVSAPSSLAVSAADRLGVTLAAFVRDGRLTLYAHPERVVTEPTAPGANAPV